jgi:anti-sigma B factor antagonist
MAGKVTMYDEGLRNCVRQSLEAGERQFVLNLHDVSYMDSAGLGQLVTAYTTVMTAGGNLRLLSPGPRVRRLLEITKLDSVFTILENEGAIGGSTAA